MSLDNLRTIETVVTGEERDLMRERLAENQIDLVVLAAEWPETFSYAAFEALGAGCDILTLKVSGNVAVVVEKMKRGVVFESAEDLSISSPAARRSPMRAGGQNSRSSLANSNMTARPWPSSDGS